MTVWMDSVRTPIMLGMVALLFLTLTNAVDHPEDFVNLLAGSFTEGNKFSTGNTLPLVGYPWGFNHWAPMTKHDGRAGSWWFLGNDHTFTWMRCTHQPSPWIGDWGWFLFSPQMGNGDGRNPEHFWEPRGATIKPHIFDATVAPHNIRMELAPSMHGAIFRVTFPTQAQKGEKKICFAKAHWTGQGSSPTPWITGKATQINTDRMAVPNFAMHLRAESPEAKSIEDHMDVKCFKYNNDAGVVTVRMATSLISPDQALTNLNREIPSSATFETVAAEARSVWNSLLKRVDVVDPGLVSGFSAKSLTVFYTGLMRGLSFPRRLDEIDASGKMVHYSPYNGRGGTYSGPLVTDNGFWDTFRAVYPMLTLLYPDHLGVIIEGWLNSFLEGGWLPTWASPGYRNCMVGTYADVVVADAIVRGVKGFNMKVAQRALEKDAFTEPPRLSGGSMGKEGLREYEDKGYISCDRHSCGDQVSRTLDFGFADWSTAQAFSVLADKPEFSEMKDTLKSQAQKLLSRSDRSYHSLFDSGMGLMRPKGNSGAFIFPFSDTEWGRGFTEGNTWHHSFPPYAIEGLAVMHGGKDKLLAKLHVMLNTQGNFGVGSYGQEIHEMTEARAVAMGQYAHNNQPAHHILFLFAMLGDRVTTEQSVRAIMDRAYGVEHFAGDEDNGEMGSWYVLSALGLFETVPGSTKYVFASPVFRHVRVARYDTSAAPPQGQRDQFGGWAASVPPIAFLDIVALGTGEKVTHVEKVLMDDAEIAGSFMEDAPLQKGGVLRFVMEGEKVNGVLPPFPGKDPSVTEESALRQQLASIPVPVDSGRSASSSDASAPDSSVLKALREELTHSQEVQAELHTRIHHLQLQDMNPSHCSRRLSFWVMLLMMAGVLAIAYSVASCFDALLGKGALMQTVNGMVGATHKYKNGKPESHVV